MTSSVCVQEEAGGRSNILNVVAVYVICRDPSFQISKYCTITRYFYQNAREVHFSAKSVVAWVDLVSELYHCVIEVMDTPGVTLSLLTYMLVCWQLICREWRDTTNSLRPRTIINNSQRSRSGSKTLDIHLNMSVAGICI